MNLSFRRRLCPLTNKEAEAASGAALTSRVLELERELGAAKRTIRQADTSKKVLCVYHNERGTAGSRQQNVYCSGYVATKGVQGVHYDENVGAGISQGKGYIFVYYHETGVVSKYTATTEM